MSTRIVLIGLALALVAAPAALAQEAVSREEAAAAETERRSFFRPSESCRDCPTLGDRELFEYPLYDDCDVDLLQSIFDRDFAYCTFRRHLARICGTHNEFDRRDPPPEAFRVADDARWIFCPFVSSP